VRRLLTKHLLLTLSELKPRTHVTEYKFALELLLNLLYHFRR